MKPVKTESGYGFVPFQGDNPLGKWRFSYRAETTTRLAIRSYEIYISNPERLSYTSKHVFHINLALDGADRVEQSQKVEVIINSITANLMVDLAVQQMNMLLEIVQSIHDDIEDWMSNFYNFQELIKEFDESSKQAAAQAEIVTQMIEAKIKEKTNENSI